MPANYFLSMSRHRNKNKGTYNPAALQFLSLFFMLLLKQENIGPHSSYSLTELGGFWPLAPQLQLQET